MVGSHAGNGYQESKDGREKGLPDPPSQVRGFRRASKILDTCKCHHHTQHRSEQAHKRRKVCDRGEDPESFFYGLQHQASRPLHIVHANLCGALQILQINLHDPGYRMSTRPRHLQGLSASSFA